MTLKELVYNAHNNSRVHGWYDGPPRNIPEMLALIHSEVSEALEDYRHSQEEPDRMKLCVTGSGKFVGFPSELADIVIRVADLCGYLEIDLEEAVRLKHEYNVSRPYRHGNKKA